MIFDALVLAGGRGSRLAGAPKALLVFEGQTLVERTLDAAQDARRRVLVGDAGALGGVLGGHGVLFAREDPPFAGPAAAIAAGFAALCAAAHEAGLAGAIAPDEWVLVLACDMPQVGRAVVALCAAAEADPAKSLIAEPAGRSSEAADPTRPDAIVARSPDGRLQPLAALYRATALARCIDVQRAAGTLDHLSVRALLGSLGTVPVEVPAGSTDDVDTPADAGRFGIGLP